VTPPKALTARIRAEFLEMPGLKLTLPQACRLWNVDDASCRHALATLAAEGFLTQTRSGAYVLMGAVSLGARAGRRVGTVPATEL
jgi:DNA-binding IclR family transcriptional regulator